MKFTSSVFTDASGSIGGTTYSKNANGMYTRKRAKSTNRNSPSQLAARARFSVVSKGWAELSVSEKNSYIAQIPNYPYVDKLGQTKNYTGAQLYKKLNGALYQAGLATLPFCNPPISLPNALEAAANADQSLGEINVSAFVADTFSGAIPAGFTCQMYATNIMPKGKYAPKLADFRNIFTLYENENIAGVDFAGPYEIVFSEAWKESSSLGFYFYFGFRFISNATGQANGNLFSIKVLIVA